MNDERGFAGRSRVPDHIPPDIIDDHEESARFQVTAERIYNEGGQHERRRRWIRIARPAGGFGPWSTIVASILAVLSTAAWLIVRPDSAVAFMVASLCSVAAVASAFHSLGRWWSRWSKTEV